MGFRRRKIRRKNKKGKRKQKSLFGSLWGKQQKEALSDEWQLAKFRVGQRYRKLVGRGQ